MSAKLIALAAAAGLAAAGLALWSTSRPIAPPAGKPASAQTAPPAGEPASARTAPPAGEEASAAGDSSRQRPRDRDLTAVPEAFALYEEGIRLFDRLPVQAAARFRKAASLDPAFAPAHYRLAVTDLILSRQDEARSAVRSARDAQERLPEPYRSTLPVLGHFADGAFDLAVASLAEALARQGTDADLRYIAGTISARVCDYFDPNSVIEHYEKTLAAQPGYPGVRSALMEAYEMKGMSDWLLSRAQERQASQPQEISAIAELGRARMMRGEYGDAIEAADEIVRRGEDVLALGLGPAFILTGHFDQLEAMFDPEAERTHTGQANVLAHLHAGINDVWTGRFAGAGRHFERGPEFAPAPWDKSVRARFLLLRGRTYALSGRTAEANAAFESAMTVAGPQAVLEYALGMNLLKAGNRAEAERVVHRLSRESRVSQPGWTEPWRRLMAGEVALAAGDVPRALDAFRDAWQLEEPLSLDCIVGHADAYFLDALGRGFLAAGRPAEALQYFEVIRALGARGLHQPEIAVMAGYHSGRALGALGREEEAAARYRQFVNLWGDAEGAPGEVADARSRLRGRRGAGPTPPYHQDRPAALSEAISRRIPGS